jgi:transposase
MTCPMCKHEGYKLEIKDFPEYIRKEFTCSKCGVLIKAENWDRKYL